MKKLFLFLTFMIGALAVHAEENYTYLIFETTDGMKASVLASSLTITVSGNTLTVGERTFELSNLAKMYFSTTEETTAIKEVTATEWDEAADIYDLNGHKVSRDMLQKGVYVIKSKKGTYKIVVK